MLKSVDMTAKTDDSSSLSSGLLDRTLKILRARSEELRARGIVHAAVFGSVARGEDEPDSDVCHVVDVGRDVDWIEGMRVEKACEAHVGRELQIISRCGLHHVRHAYTCA